MATGETGSGDVVYDLVSVQYHSLKAGFELSGVGGGSDPAARPSLRAG